MEEVHKKDLTDDLSSIKAEVCEVKEMLNTVNTEVRDNSDVLAALSNKAEEVLQQIFQLLQQPAPVPKKAFREVDRQQLDRVATFNILQDEDLSTIDHRIEDLSSSLNDLSSHLDNDKEGEKYKEVENITPVETTIDVAAEDIPHADALIPASEDAIITYANAKDDDDVVIAPGIHEDHPSTSALQNTSNEDEDEDDDEKDEDNEPHLLDVGKDLGDNDDDEDDDDNFSIQFHPRQPALKESSSGKLQLPRGETLSFRAPALLQR
ncbi:coiled-coil domain-containing protein 1-like [Cynara cardunculus var. scolymus]|uniref:coiled-coil domain-containing protein 1-like n=1 Tax=Cynara cardunculus var. scolymus TaxID=59895 RepID=UPI000D629A4F|nr:coiled-coil domain-containing protein 1-like [Cynara cardunculus var. scolymus]